MAKNKISFQERVQNAFQNINTLFGSNVFTTIAGLVKANQDQKRLDLFREEQQAIGEELIGGTESANERLLRDTEQFASQSLAESEHFFGTTQPGAFSALQEEGRLFGGEIVALEQARSASILSEIEGLGEAERDQLNRNADIARRRSTGRLSALGLGSTSVGASTIGAQNTAQQQNLSLLNERLTRERVDTISGLSRDVIGAQTAAGQLNLDLSAAGIEFAQSNFENRIGNRREFSLAGGEEQLAGQLRINELRTEGIVNEPPVVNQAATNELIFNSAG